MRANYRCSLTLAVYFRRQFETDGRHGRYGDTAVRCGRSRRPHRTPVRPVAAARYLTGGGPSIGRPRTPGLRCQGCGPAGGR